MKKVIIVFVLFLSLASISGQSTNRTNRTKHSELNLKKNIIDLAWGGSGQFLSINYSRVLRTKETYFISGLIGIGTILFTESNLFSDNEGGTTIPHQLSINFGKKNGFVELGITGVYLHENISKGSNRIPKTDYYLAPLIGYRYNYRRIVLKIQANPIIPLRKSLKVSNHFTSYIGMSLGFGF